MNGPDYSQLKKSTIMLVDDEPVMLDIVQALLEEEGYQRFVSVEHSPEAINRMINSNPDILLLDLDMPEVNGFEVLTQVRSHEKFQHLPVIILTAAEDPQSKLKALELGATDFLSKPVDPSELALRVRNTLSAKAYQDQLAYYDSLTGLPNRHLFFDRLGWGIEVAKRENEILVLLDMSLDRFRAINETLGVSTGDSILKSVTARLRHVIRSSDIVGRQEEIGDVENMARIAGDEFTIVLSGIHSVDNASMVSQRIIDIIQEPFTIDGEDLYISASIGIAVFPDDSDDVETLFKHAAAAKDFAQKKGKGYFQYYSAEMNKHSRALLKMEADLRSALELQQFELYYQPQVDSQTGNILGVESLIRWFHPEDGLISPFHFIPLAEDMELIIPIGDWVLHEACNRASEWVSEINSDLKISVNVSAKQFKHSGFKDSVISALTTSGLNPENLVLEITESVLMGNIEQYVDLMLDIEKLGVSFSLDDFGTGYSSLSYLKRFPISELKIDRSFLLDVPSNKEDCSIVRAIIAMAHGLGQKVVAEGVEEAVQLDFLRTQNCDIIQGYYYSKPLCHADFSEYLAQKSISASHF